MYIASFSQANSSDDAASKERESGSEYFVFFYVVFQTKFMYFDPRLILKKKVQRYFK